MKIHIYLLALTPFALGGCVIHETVPVTTTTQVTREVTTTGPVTREVVVTEAPAGVDLTRSGGHVWAGLRGLPLDHL